MQHSARPSKINHSLAPSIDARFAALEHALEHEEATQILGILEPLKDLLATNKLEQLHLLIAAEQVLSNSPTNTEQREDLLLGLINRLQVLGYEDLLMTTFDRMSGLLREQGKCDAAEVCGACSRQLRAVVFGDSLDEIPLPKAEIASPSSHTDRDGVIPIRFEAFNAITSLGTLLEVRRALQRGREYFEDEKWQAAKGAFTTAAALIDTPKATVKKVECTGGNVLHSESDAHITKAIIRIYPL